MQTRVMIDRLNSLLRAELTAIETYELALKDRAAFSGKTELSQCLLSHMERAQILRDRIEALGGVPTQNAGLWGAFATVVEKGAIVLGDDVAIRALEEGEDRRLADYRTQASKLDESMRSFFETTLLLEQERTHRMMSELLHRVDRDHRTRARA
jgi:bacterioferritin (cytochrome b1)